MSQQWRIDTVKFLEPPRLNFFFIFMQFSGKIGRIFGWHRMMTVDRDSHESNVLAFFIFRSKFLCVLFEIDL